MKSLNSQWWEVEAAVEDDEFAAMKLNFKWLFSKDREKIVLTSTHRISLCASFYTLSR